MKSYHIEFTRTLTLAVVISVPVTAAAIGIAYRLWRRGRRGPDA